MEARVPFRAATDDNWVFLSPSNRATSFQERERERESKRDPRPRQRAPHFLGGCQALPSFTAGPSFPYHTKCHSMLSWEAWRQKEALRSLLPFQKKGALMHLPCDHHCHASLEHARALHLPTLDQVWPLGQGCSAEKGQSPVPPGEFLGLGWSFLP